MHFSKHCCCHSLAPILILIQIRTGINTVLDQKPTTPPFKVLTKNLSFIFFIMPSVKRLHLCCNNCPRDGCPKGPLSEETFVQGDFYLRDVCPRRLLSKQNIAQANCCPSRKLSKQTFVQGNVCPRRLFSKGNVVHVRPSRL